MTTRAFPVPAAIEGFRGRALAVLALALLAQPGTAAGQGVPRYVEARGTGAVVVTLTVPVGSLSGSNVSSGTASLLAEALVAEANRRLADRTARVEASVGRVSTRFQLVSSPTGWDAAWELASAAIFSSPPAARFEEVRSRAVAAAAFSDGSPVEEFEAELTALLTGRAARQARAGDPASISFADVDALHRSGYRSSHALTVVTGPGWALPSAGLEAPGRAEASGTVDSAAVAEIGANTGIAAVGAPWATGRRSDLRRNVTASWIGLAYPVQSDVPRTELEFAADLVRAELMPDPPLPSTYGVDVAIAEVPDGTVVLVRAAFHPDRAARWIDDALATVRELRGAPPDGTLFLLARRAFRARSLLADANGSDAGLRISDDLLREGRVRRLGSEISALTPESLARAFDGLGEPRVLVFGPSLGGW